MVRSTVPTTVAARLAVVPTDSLSGVIVGSLSASAVSSTAIRLSWQLLQPHRQVVEGFRIKYRSLNDAGDDDVVDYLVKNVRPGDVMQFLLTGELPVIPTMSHLSLLLLSIVSQNVHPYNFNTCALFRATLVWVKIAYSQYFI